jgi:hypothetical protein
MTEKRPAHSPLGASGAARWMICSGSVALTYGIQDEESEYAAEGTAAHTLGETCLFKGTDAWESIGTLVGPGDEDGPDMSKCWEVGKDMADAVQVYLDYVHATFPERNQSNSFVERKFHCPTVHPLFYGQSDFTHINEHERILDVIDYKHGAGIVVEAKENPQLMYYAVGMLEDLDLWRKIDMVNITIAQPRGFHFDGPIRSWSITTADLETWLDDVLLPAMDLALTSRDTKSGEHCRFCPARGRACPQLIDDMNELEELMMTTEAKGGAKALTNVQLGRFLTLFDVAKIIHKAALKSTFVRLEKGGKVPGRKLANSRTNREWKGGAEDALKEKFGAEALTEPKLKTPAVIDAMAEGAALTARWAFKPQGKQTVVAESDSRVAVEKDTKSLFTDQTRGKRRK